MRIRMRRWVVACVAICAGAFSLNGCGELTEDTSSQPQQQATPAPPPPPPIAGDTAEIVADSNVVGSSPAEVAQERVKADVGVGVKGRRLEDERLVQTIVQPAVSLFRARERVVFQIQIPQAMQLYEAMHGKKPATEEEFFSQIVKANNLQLPELPPGQRYVYDPEKAQLMVERPAR